MNKLNILSSNGKTNTIKEEESSLFYGLLDKLKKVVFQTKKAKEIVQGALDTMARAKEAEKVVGMVRKKLLAGEWLPGGEAVLGLQEGDSILYISSYYNFLTNQTAESFPKVLKNISNIDAHDEAIRILNADDEYIRAHFFYIKLDN